MECFHNSNIHAKYHNVNCLLPNVQWPIVKKGWDHGMCILLYCTSTVQYCTTVVNTTSRHLTGRRRRKKKFTVLVALVRTRQTIVRTIPTIRTGCSQKAIKPKPYTSLVVAVSSAQRAARARAMDIAKDRKQFQIFSFAFLPFLTNWIVLFFS